MDSLEKVRKSSRKSAWVTIYGVLIVIASLVYSYINLYNLEKNIEEKNKELIKVQESINALRTQLAAATADFKDIKAKLSDQKHILAPNRFNEDIKTSINSIETKIAAASQSAKDVNERSMKETYYYVIAMTSAAHKDIFSETDRVKKKMGESFFNNFPNIEAYAPDDGLYTLLISGQKLPYKQANELKQRAVSAGFSKETWLWQSNVGYFNEKNRKEKIQEISDK